jgi:hypothetical protein
MEQLFQNENKNEVERNNKPFEERSIFFQTPKLNPTKLHKLKRNKKSLNNYMLKEKYGGFIIKICYVGHFII